MSRAGMLALVLSFVFVAPAAYAATDVYPTPGGTFGSHTWTKAGSPYIIHDQPSFRAGSLTVEPGAVVKFFPGARLNVHADVLVTIAGTLEEPVYFTSYKDDSVGGDTNGDGAATTPSPGDWGYASFGGGSWNDDLDINYLKVRYGGSTSVTDITTVVYPSLVIAYPWFSGSPGKNYTLEHVETSYGAGVGLYAYVGQSNSLTILNSSFRDNASFGLYRPRILSSKGDIISGSLDGRNNWWGDPTGPYHPTGNLGGLGDAVDPRGALKGPIAYYPWLTADPMPDPLPPPSCCSSVMFFPGIEGSRLYENENRLWEGDDAAVLDLYLNENGDSERPDIYTKDVIGIFDGPLDINIYQSFLDDLATKKDEGAIADYAAVPYDWRLAIPDILASGKEEAGGQIFYNRATSTPYIEQTLRKLAEDSLTGKVTIVTHSNGGLVAKALVSALGDDAPELIDQMILVAAPQLGTPQAIGGLLHGFKADIPFQLSEERARDFAKNAPMSYQLLPHEDYYNNAGATITTPVVSFEPGVATQAFIDSYGTFIGNGDDLRDFLNAVEGRPAPAYDDLDNPAIAHSGRLADAEALMDSIGSSWQPPAGITVHQIAGIGADTLAGITYKSIETCTAAVGVGGGNPVCLKYQSALSYTPDEVVDGDGTVVVPSALAMSTDNEQVKRWWVDLDTFNDIEHPFANIPGFSFLRIEHAKVFEINNLRTFILDNLIGQSSDTLPTYISSSFPVVVAENRLRFILHSPLSLSATSPDGEISEGAATLPGASYKRYGGVQVLTVPADVSPTLILDGVADGSFTLEVEEYAGDTLTATTTFSGIPSSAATIASMNFPDGTIENAGNLALDYDGDTTIDLELAPEAGETVMLAEPSLEDLIAILKAKLQDFSFEEKLKAKLLKKVAALETKIEKKKAKNASLLLKLNEQITKKEMKGKLDSASADALLALIAELEAGSDMLAFDNETLAALKDAIVGLNAEEKLKNTLLKRVEKLENKQALTNALTHLSANITQKGEKGDISTTDVNELLELLGKIEAAI